MCVGLPPSPEELEKMARAEDVKSFVSSPI